MESLATHIVHFFESRCCPGSTCLVTKTDDDSSPPDSERRNLVNQMALATTYTKSKDEEKEKDKSFMTPEYTPIEGNIQEDIPMENKASDAEQEANNEDGDRSKEKHSKGEMILLLY